ncbi:UDP-glycosyltransferase CGT [Cryptomeria japonica]|uniref:UDP-glycosyltransferase CGT n=1 Tax=Cryptomeria japonica TaxID=3369 RepID=UPI0027DA4BB5|nr:UDP-glycosyltransferase CGT [Cryptomeria japonica]
MAALAEKEKRHVAVFPSAEMGHFMPFLHLARTLAIHHGFTVTFITATQNVSPTETAHVHRLATSGLDIHVVKLQIESHETSEDPFLAQWEAMRASMPAFENLLTSDLLKQTPPVSAIITDPVLTPTLSIAAKLNIPNYVLFTASAFTLGLMVHAPLADAQGFGFSDEKAVLQIPGFPALHAEQIPQALKIKDHIFRRVFLASGLEVPKASGILVNTVEELEQQCLQSLRSRDALPPVYAIGPLFLPSDNSSTLDDEAERQCLKWLDAQPAKSVVYVSFGSRSAMSAAQINELALGLESSEQRFLWVLRTSIVDGAGSMLPPLPPGFEERVGERGIIVSSWVPQVKILSHVSTGAFVSHCGWNSVVEGLCCGNPILAWPLAGDQMINATIVVENAKAGIEVRKREDGIVSREEISSAVKAIVERKELTEAAIRFQQLGRMAIMKEGSSYKSLKVAFQYSN